MKTGIITGLGIATGDLIHVLLAAIGFSAIRDHMHTSQLHGMGMKIYQPGIIKQYMYMVKQVF